jgi:hypothetical protein
MKGEYAKALQNHYKVMHLEIDPYGRSYIPYNIGLIHTSNGEHAKALEYYFQAQLSLLQIMTFQKLQLN